MPRIRSGAHARGFPPHPGPWFGAGQYTAHRCSQPTLLGKGRSPGQCQAPYRRSRHTETGGHAAAMLRGSGAPRIPRTPRPRRAGTVAAVPAPPSACLPLPALNHGFFLCPCCEKCPENSGKVSKRNRCWVPGSGRAQVLRAELGPASDRVWLERGPTSPSPLANRDTVFPPEHRYPAALCLPPKLSDLCRCSRRLSAPAAGVRRHSRRASPPRRGRCGAAPGSSLRARPLLCAMLSPPLPAVLRLPSFLPIRWCRRFAAAAAGARAGRSEPARTGQRKL